jgi:predicted outer membrane protein
MLVVTRLQWSTAMMFRSSTALVILGASVFAIPVFSQQAVQPQPRQAQPGQAQPQAGQPGRPGIPSQGPGQAHPMVTEQSIAACLAIANQEEITIAKWASEKTKNKDVKEFAKHLIDDHEAFLKKLQRFTPEAQNTTLETASAESGAAQPGRVQQAGAQQPQQGQAQQAQAQPQQRPVQQTAGQQPQQGPQGAPIDLVRLDREIAQQCLSAAKKKMGEKDSDKFDACFVGHQLAKHEAMKTKLEVLQRHVSGEFAQVLADGSKAVDKHLKDAEKLMDDLVDVKSSKK